MDSKGQDRVPTVSKKDPACAQASPQGGSPFRDHSRDNSGTSSVVACERRAFSFLIYREAWNRDIMCAADGSVKK